MTVTTRAIAKHVLPCVLAIGLVADGPKLRADELDDQIKVLTPQLEDNNAKIADRERIALEIAANLDAAAQAATTSEVRRGRWVEAASVLDQFRARNPGHPQAPSFALKAAVYRWAEAQGWIAMAEAHPAEVAPRAHALEALDAAVSRLEPLVGAKGAVVPEARYRLAHALADRATLVDEGAKAARQRALALLDPPVREPGLKGFALLLRARLLTKLEDFDRAGEALEEAAKADPAPTTGERLDARVDLLLARQRFDEALKAAEGRAEDAGPPTRDRLAFRVALSRYLNLPAGPARSSAEADLFRRAEAFRDSGGDEARSALAALARAVDEPGPGLGPESWDALAEGQWISGHPARAGALVAVAAEKAQVLGHRDQANRLRLRAAALAFQGGAIGQADSLLSRVVDDPRAGALRAQAGLLRILARAKVLEREASAGAATSYREALESQIREFPADEGANEARWRLGKAQFAAGERERAVDLWAAIPHGSPRWLPARLAALDLLEDDLDAPLLNDDRGAARRAMEETQRFLDRASAQAGDGPERPDLEFRRALLDLTPELGRPEAALTALDRLVRSSGSDGLRDRARRLRIVALAQLGRAVEAEREARVESADPIAGEMLDLCRRLDRTAWATQSDLARRRIGGIMRSLLASLVAQPGGLAPIIRNEVTLRLARARFFSGDPNGARKGLNDAAIDPEALDDRLLADLADLLAELEAHQPAVDAYRLLARRRHAGSIPWLAARYGQALAYFHAGKGKEARQLIDGTAILHPELGGGGLRNKFERLRARLVGGSKP